MEWKHQAITQWTVDSWTHMLEVECPAASGTDYLPLFMWSIAHRQYCLGMSMPLDLKSSIYNEPQVKFITQVVSLYLPYFHLLGVFSLNQPTFVINFLKEETSGKHKIKAGLKSTVGTWPQTELEDRDLEELEGQNGSPRKGLKTREGVGERWQASESRREGRFSLGI